jgi:ApbE superfamily uncharacterized protein (UPF0280 family)
VKRRIVAIALGLAAALGVTGGIVGATVSSGHSDANTVVAWGSSWS